MSIFNFNQATIDELWQLIMEVDYDYSRISIADHEFTDGTLILYLEDRRDFKSTLDECLKLEISSRQFSQAIIRDGLINNTVGDKVDAISWYQDEASSMQQTWAREAMLKEILTRLVERELRA